jgi:hypothetical protein
MNFTNGKINVSVYLDEMKIFIDGIRKNILEVKFNTPTQSRFRFEKCDAKINNSILTYTNKTTGKVYTLTKTDDNVNDEQQEWTEYVVHKELTVSVDVTKTYIKVNGAQEAIEKVRKEGIYNIYVCQSGEMYISGDEYKRPNMWNGVIMDLKE